VWGLDVVGAGDFEDRLAQCALTGLALIVSEIFFGAIMDSASHLQWVSAAACRRQSLCRNGAAETLGLGLPLVNVGDTSTELRLRAATGIRRAGLRGPPCDAGGTELSYSNFGHKSAKRS